jgi:hypothetical protein
MGSPTTGGSTTGSTRTSTTGGGSTSIATTGSTSQKPTLNDDGAVGTMARAYLRRSPATSLTVEVDYVSGRQPQQSALDHLKAILERELDKPAGISIRVGSAIASNTTSWTVQAMVAFERAHRNDHSSGAHASMWFGYVGGSFADNANALAVAFTASSSMIFRDRLNDATSALVIEPEIERSVITHEAGHLLALVNLGYRSKHNHEDPQHPGHSSDPDSVMYWAVEDISIRTIVHGGPPSDFDQDDRDDLAMLRGY